MKNNKKTKRTILKTVLITIVIIIVLTGAIINFLIKIKAEANVLIFYHSWVSSGEQAAINALINVFSAKYPTTTIIPTPVVSQSSGGGGVALFNLVKPMVFAKEAPDAFQMHAGYEAKTFVDAGLLENVDDIWKSEKLEEMVPKTVQAMCQFQGHYYSVPINIHRTNVVWYNKKILDENKINPKEITTWDDFFSACQKLREAGVEYPIQMGTTWTAQHTFDQIIASIGIDFYENWINGKVISSSGYDPRLIEAFDIFQRYLSYTNPDHTQVSWDQATARIIAREGAFNIMGDWANGEFKAAKQRYNEDYGSFIVPGTNKMYGFVIDTFQLPQGIQHQKNAKNWLKVVASKEGQDAFNPLKGSISARIDTNISKYDAYQQSAILDFLVMKYMFPAVSNGMPKAFEEKEQKVIAQFIKDLDANKAANEIANYIKTTSMDYTITWELD